MKIKIKFIKVTHLPGNKGEFKSYTFTVKHKKKMLHDGFMSGPFLKTKKLAKQVVKHYMWNNVDMLSDEF